MYLKCNNNIQITTECINIIKTGYTGYSDAQKKILALKYAFFMNHAGYM